MSDEITPFDQEAFEALRDGRWRPPTVLTLALPAWAPTPDPHALLERPLPAPFGELELELVEPDEDEQDALFVLSGDDVRVTASEVDIEIQGPAGTDASMTEADVEAVQGANHAIRVTTTLGEPVLERFHETVKLASALAPDAVALHDDGAMIWRSATWIDGTVSSVAPPSPLHLFTLHAVTHEGRMWLHTHGLLRCGAIELEVLDAAPESRHALMYIVNTAALLTIERGTPEPHDAFVIGKDMTLAWRLWDEAVNAAGPLAVGGLDDRESHDFLVGTLAVPTGRKRGFIRKRPVWASVEELVPIVDDNPLFFRSTMETRRASMLASEHFGVFRDLAQRHVDEDDWIFHVKLGYQVDDEENGPVDGNEHLWFAVHAVDGARIDATLLNQPYGIARMSQGDRDWHPADQLSDWTIEAFDEVFGPDRIDQLLARLARDE